MANEIRITASIDVLNGTFDQEVRPSQLAITQNTQGSGGGVLTLTTAATAVAFSTGNATTCGYAFFRNVSTANNALIGTGTATPVVFMKLGAGEYSMLRLGTNAPTARCDVGTVNVQYFILAD
tara:strand:+ start:1184 stop:1552 length:369 start_codon:yes stop_codon:yes gene_type:complete